MRKLPIRSGNLGLKYMVMHKGVLARDGATAQVVTDIDETADDAYDEIWPALA